MNDGPVAALVWLVSELSAEFSRTREFGTIHEFLEELHGFDREFVLGSLLWHAMQISDWPLAEKCLSEGFPIAPDPNDIAEFGPLHSAMSLLGDCPGVVAWLIRHGAEVERPGIFNATPLIAACAEGLPETVLLLINSGADVNVSTNVDDELTPLMAAAKSGNERIVTMLLEHGATPNHFNSWGKTAVDMAEARGKHSVARVIRAAERRMPST